MIDGRVFLARHISEHGVTLPAHRHGSRAQRLAALVRFERGSPGRQGRQRKAQAVPLGRAPLAAGSLFANPTLRGGLPSGGGR